MTVDQLVVAVCVGALAGLLARSIKNRHIHRWGKWSQYTIPVRVWDNYHNPPVVVEKYTEVWQSRACDTCGLVQERLLRGRG